MIFKNATCFTISNMEAVTREKLAELNDFPVTEPHKTQLSSLGWCHPFEQSDSFIMPIPFAGEPRYTVICMVEVYRNIDNASIKREVKKRCDALFDQSGVQLTRKERLVVKEEVVVDALPGALCKERRTLAYIDHEKALLVINQDSIKKCDEFTSQLRERLGSLPVIPLQTKYRPEVIMNEWLKENTEPSYIDFKGEAIFKSPLDLAQTAKVKHVDIDSQVISEILDMGMVPQQLYLTWVISEHIKADFHLKDNLALKSINLDYEVEELEDFSGQDQEADKRSEYEATALLFMDSVSDIFSKLVVVFGGFDD